MSDLYIGKPGFAGAASYDDMPPSPDLLGSKRIVQARGAWIDTAIVHADLVIHEIVHP